MTSDEFPNIPVRPQQPPPADVVQQQIRLLVQAVDALAQAVNQTDRKHTVDRDSVAPTALIASELVAEVAELGGWSDSLLDVGTHVTDGDDEYVVGAPE